MRQDIDVRGLSLPKEFRRGLQKLLARATFGSSSKEAVDRFFGSDPAFGQVQRTNAESFRSSKDTGLSLDLSARLSDVAELFSHIQPTTVICDTCSEFGLDNTGGSISKAGDGESCVYCKDGTFELIPLKLLRINWATGELLSVAIEEDLHSNPGVRIPLSDRKILERYKVDGGLKRRLREAYVPIHGFLAYFIQERRTISVDQAPELLQDPAITFELQTEEKWTACIGAIQRFLDEREVTNLPHKEFLSDGKRRSEFTQVRVSSRPYLIEGKIARGDKSDVYRARSDSPTTQQVIIKVLRALDDEDLFKQEISTLKKLSRSEEQGSEFFLMLIPEIVDSGTIHFNDGSQAPAVVYRNRDQFDWTLKDVMSAYPEGIDVQTFVWVFKRILMLLDFVHLNGLVHGAIVPEHVLLHIVDHGARIVDFSYAQRSGERLKAFSGSNRAYYPDEVIGKKSLNTRVDVAMASRCMIALLGGDFTVRSLPNSVSREFGELLFRNAGFDSLEKVSSDAFVLREEVSALAKRLFGPPKYHNFVMPS